MARAVEEGAPAPCGEPAGAPPTAAAVARPAAAGRRPLLPVVSLAIVYVVWGSTYLAIRVAVETIPPLLMAGVRFLLGGAIVYAVAITRGDRRGDRPRAIHWRSALVIGGLLLVSGNAVVGEAERTLPSGIAALLVATVPFWFAGLDRVATGTRLRRGAVAGIVVGFAGVVILVGPTAGQHIDPLGVGLIVFATVGWAAGSLYSRTARLPQRPFVASGMEMLAGGGLALGVGLAIGEGRDLHLAAVSTRSLVALAYLVIAGSLLAYTAYQHALHTLPTATVATYAYVNPVIAVALGALILGEHLGVETVVAAAVMVVGVALVVRNPTPPAGTAG